MPSGDWRTTERGIANGREAFRRLRVGDWSGRVVVELPLSRPWSVLHGAPIPLEQWRAAWPNILEGVSGAWEVLKRDRAGLVARGTIDLGQRAVHVVAKQPLPTRASHLLVDAARGSRASRTWRRTWQLYLRGLPTEIPMMVMDQRRGPLVLANVAVFEHVPGSTIFHANLDALASDTRRALFWRVGATLRRIEELGFSHRDAKTTNWIIYERHGRRSAVQDSPPSASTVHAGAAVDLVPVMLDCYGVRRLGGAGTGLDRFLRALVRHPQCRGVDVTSVCHGYAPYGWSKRVHRMHEQYGSRPAC